MSKPMPTVNEINSLFGALQQVVPWWFESNGFVQGEYCSKGEDYEEYDPADPKPTNQKKCEEEEEYDPANSAM